MDKYIESFPDQLLEALRLCSGYTLTEKKKVDNVIITGMGGSAIGAKLVKSILGDAFPITVHINRTYTMPAFANEKTLAIFSSYSGDTEETLAAFIQAKEMSCTKVCITSGGILHQIAIENNIPVIIIPGGMPPRTCVGYNMVAIFCILQSAGIVNDAFVYEIQSTAKKLIDNREFICVKARSIAESLVDKIPMIYSTSAMDAVGERWKQQFNENAKMHCFNNVIPEMNHNELVAFTTTDSRFKPMFLLQADERNVALQHRIVSTIDLLETYDTSSIRIEAIGNSEIERILYLVHLGDWVSLFLAKQKKVDPIDITMLNTLKIILKSKTS